MTNKFASFRTLAALALVITLAVTSCSPAAQPTPTAVSTSTRPAPTATTCIPGYGKLKIVYPYGPDTKFNDWAVADFTGDGLADILIARGIFKSPEDFPAYFFSNTGRGSFVDAVETTFEGSIPRSQCTREIIQADFNGDNLMDIYIADHGNDQEPFPGYQNRLILTAPGGKLVDASDQLPQLNDFTHSAAVADIDNDGDVDIYVGNIWGGNAISPYMLLNDGQANFSIAWGLLPAAQSNMNMNKYTTSLFADVNNDGSPDLILGADDFSRESAVLLNNGIGQFSLLRQAIPASPDVVKAVALDIAAGDLTGDGYLDLAITWTQSHYLGRYIQVLINQGDGMFVDETKTRIPSQVGFGDTGWWFKFIELTDADHDGDLDLLTHVIENSVAFENNGSGVFKPSTSLLPLPRSSWYWYSLADVDGDGHKDLVANVPPTSDLYSAAIAVALWKTCP